MDAASKAAWDLKLILAYLAIRRPGVFPADKVAVRVSRSPYYEGDGPLSAEECEGHLRTLAGLGLVKSETAGGFDPGIVHGATAEGYMQWIRDGKVPVP